MQIHWRPIFTDRDTRGTVRSSVLFEFITVAGELQLQLATSDAFTYVVKVRSLSGKEMSLVVC